VKRRLDSFVRTGPGRSDRKHARRLSANQGCEVVCKVHPRP
jgi:hypothetical protein